MKYAAVGLNARGHLMPTSDSTLRRELIRAKFQQCTGRAPDARATAAATAAIWPQITRRLTPVVGVRGVDALFNRTLHLVTGSFQWLAPDADRGLGITLLDAVAARLRQQEVTAAVAASCELLFVFSEQLAALIGDTLTDRLLGPVWALPTPNSEQERRS
jgi:hypothetical protein